MHACTKIPQPACTARNGYQPVHLADPVNVVPIAGRFIGAAGLRDYTDAVAVDWLREVPPGEFDVAVLALPVQVLSGTFRGDGEYAHIRAFEATFAPEMPMLGANRAAYVAAAGTPDGWAWLVEKMRMLPGAEYDWSEQVRSIQAPALIALGDADTLPPGHAVELFGLLGGGGR
jgi:pimeloyl-ACP methyl ester carboxylesterase